MATLALTCVLLCFWTRSHLYFDAIHIPVGKVTSVCLMSVAGSITINFDINQQGENEASSQHYELASFNAQISDWFDAFKQFGNFMKKFTLKWRWCGFGVGMCLDGPKPHTLLAIPYWFFILVYALISWWLLLGKPRVLKTNSP